MSNNFQNGKDLKPVMNVVQMVKILAHEATCSLNKSMKFPTAYQRIMDGPVVAQILKICK